jgi:hypothetical protein
MLFNAVRLVTFRVMWSQTLQTLKTSWSTQGFLSDSCSELQRATTIVVFQLSRASRSLSLCTICRAFSRQSVFLPLIFLGTASCSFLRPAASRLLLSRSRPQHHWVPSDKAAARFGSRSPRFWVPQENGARKRRKFNYVLPQLYNSRRVCWF